SSSGHHPSLILDAPCGAGYALWAVQPRPAVAGTALIAAWGTRTEDRMSIRLHKGDLPDLSRYGRQIAIDTETMGLNPARDRLCVVQLSPGDGTADIVQIAPGQTEAPNLAALLADPERTKLFHFARFDMAAL